MPAVEWRLAPPYLSQLARTQQPWPLPPRQSHGRAAECSFVCFPSEGTLVGWHPAGSLDQDPLHRYKPDPLSKLELFVLLFHVLVNLKVFAKLVKLVFDKFLLHSDICQA